MATHESGKSPCPALIIALAIMTLCVVRGPVLAQQTDDVQYKVPHRYGMALSFAQGVALPDNYGMALLTLVGLFDYDRVWPHSAPDYLRFKVELTAGSTTWPEGGRAVVAANILALFYLDFMATPSLRPYAEAGIGGIYTDFQVDGQGSRINFNPVAGIGLEFPTESGPDWFASLRASHFSNAFLNKHNQGVNTFTTMVGAYF